MSVVSTQNPSHIEKCYSDFKNFADKQNREILKNNIITTFKVIALFFTLIACCAGAVFFALSPLIYNASIGLSLLKSAICLLGTSMVLLDKKINENNFLLCKKINAAIYNKLKTYDNTVIKSMKIKFINAKEIFIDLINLRTLKEVEEDYKKYNAYFGHPKFSNTDYFNGKASDLEYITYSRWIRNRIAVGDLDLSCKKLQWLNSRLAARV